MVTKKRSGRKAAPRRRVYAARRAAPRRRAKSGIQYIPGAAATVALVVAEAPLLKNFYKAATNNGNAKLSDVPGRIMNNTWTHNTIKAFATVDNLTKAGLAVGGGYVAGEVLKKYAPGVIKRPLGKIAKKIPKVF